mmetsp:Transcript_70465/g.132965  ORF Transcript_70465/g.132965 Transcript_70465/m.132965 type:complete len:208 (+) Transcript_70465:1190-1813(+)
MLLGRNSCRDSLMKIMICSQELDKSISRRNGSVSALSIMSDTCFSKASSLSAVKKPVAWVSLRWPAMSLKRSTSSSSCSSSSPGSEGTSALSRVGRAWPHLRQKFASAMKMLPQWTHLSAFGMLPEISDGRADLTLFCALSSALRRLLANFSASLAASGSKLSEDLLLDRLLTVCAMSEQTLLGLSSSSVSLLGKSPVALLLKDGGL